MKATIEKLPQGVGLGGKYWARRIPEGGATRDYIQTLLNDSREIEPLSHRGSINLWTAQDTLARLLDTHDERFDTEIINDCRWMLMYAAHGEQAYIDGHLGLDY